MLYGKMRGDAPKISLHGTQAAFLHGGIIGMIRILFICHGDISKSPEKACKISGSLEQKGAYYTTTTPFLKEP